MRRLLILVAICFAASIGVASSAAQKDNASPPSGEVYRAGKDGVSPPRPIKTAKPDYTDAARAAKVEGTVRLTAVVESSGNVDRISVEKSLDQKFGLDNQAIKAFQLWKFEPSKKDGKPVAVWITMDFEFRLTPRPPSKEP